MDFKQKYFGIWNAAWQFHKEFFSTKGTDEEWERITAKSGEILKQHSGTPGHEFMKKLLLAVICEIERLDKKRKRGEIE